MDYKPRVSSRAARFVVMRVLLLGVTLLAVSSIVFLVMRSIPGDPTIGILGIDATPEQRAALREEMGLNEPLSVQYGIWLLTTLSGDLGHSFSQGKEISAIIGPALEVTLRLTGVALIFAVLVGLVIGNLGTHKRREVRRTSDAVEAFFLSAPQYTVALILLVLLAVVVPLFPAGGIQSRRGGSLADQLYHLVLPGLALALAAGAQLGRSLKTAIIGVHNSELVASLNARGLAPWRIALHVHHNALPPALTVLGFQVGWMLGGALFVENIFSIPGLGSLIIQAVSVRDYQLVQGVAMIIAALFVLALLASDLLVALVDPRIRVGRV